ncbi:MAG: SDR family NAD(P)-dependent oxidoreductase, partial [Bdellovibrionota bacterium]
FLADRDGEAAEQAASSLRAEGGRARALPLDVTDAVQVEAAVGEVVREAGRIDYLFNNAGINVIGDVLKTTLADWNRVVDVNLRGVIHGVCAAYPIMVQQGFGHIVNTASAQGLGPAPAATAYTATKFAVVGLSTSLRAEAASKGVKVTVVCPGFVDTPIRDNAKYAGMTKSDFERASVLKPMSPERCARAILKGVERNEAIVPISLETRLLWWAYRLAPEPLIDLMGYVYRSRFGK